MAIQNNTSLHLSPISVGKTTTAKKSSITSSVDIAPVTKKAPAANFSMVLSEKQQESIKKTLGYDQPTPKQRGALEAYQQVAVQEKRDRIIDSMSFHFVV